jgi:hypothetical protein
MIQNEMKPFYTGNKLISSLEEFDEEYFLDVKEGNISITDRINEVVIQTFKTKSEEDQYYDYSNPTHFHKGFFYFVLSSARYKKAKYVYSFDLNKKSIKCILAPLQNPHFFEKLLVEFGSGFNTSGEQQYNFNGTGIIKIYDLTQKPGQMIVKKHIIEDGSCGGWDGRIDEEKREIHIFDHVKGNSQEFSLLDYTDPILDPFFADMKHSGS